MAQVPSLFSRWLHRAIDGKRGAGKATFSAWSWELKTRGSAWGDLRVWAIDAIAGHGHCLKAWAYHVDQGHIDPRE